jgi:hypothetical protein
MRTISSVAAISKLNLLGRRHLEVERPVDLARDAGDVLVGDVAAVLAQMRGDAVGPGRDGRLGGAHRVRMRPAAGIPDGRHMIDVDAEPQSHPTHSRRQRLSTKRATAKGPKGGPSRQSLAAHGCAKPRRRVGE